MEQLLGFDVTIVLNTLYNVMFRVKVRVMLSSMHAQCFCISDNVANTIKN